MSIQILVDTVQPRISQQSVSTLGTGYDLDLALTSSDLYVDPVTYTLMCRPGLFYDAWTSSNSGIYAKYPLSSFTTSGGTFASFKRDTDNAEFYYLPDNSGSYCDGVLTSSLSLNQPIVCEWYQESTGPSTDQSVWFGWSADPNSPSVDDIAVRFYFSGDAEVYKCFSAGTFSLVGTYTMSGTQKDRFNRNAATQGKSDSGKYMGVAMIPCRGRELLVISSEGTGFTHVFDDITEGTASPTITPATPCFFWVPGPRSCMVRMALCQFSSGGWAYYVASKWRYDPGATPVGGFQYWLDADGITPAMGPVSGSTFFAVVDAITPANPYLNNANGVRIAVQLTAGTQFVYGARAYTLPQYANTIGGGTGGAGVDITDFVTELSLTSADGNSGLHGHIAIRDPLAVAAAGAPKIWIQGNRPLQIIDDGTVVFDGVLVLPEIREGVVFDPTSETGGTTYGQELSSNPIEVVQSEIRDPWYAAERYRQKEPVPVDGLQLGAPVSSTESAKSAVQLTLREFWSDGSGAVPSIRGGITISDFGGFVLEKAGNVTTGEYNVQNRPTETGAEELTKLHQNFVGNAFVGYDPVYGFRFMAQGDMPSEPTWTFYDSEFSATAAGVPLDGQSPQIIARTLVVRLVILEANDIYVVGWDYRFRRPIIAHKADTDSQDPTLAPADRPNNWTGDVLAYSWETQHITTQTVANDACSLLYDRLTNVRALIEFEADFVPVVQRGQVVKLSFLPGQLPTALSNLGLPGIGEDYVLARIKSYDVHYEQGAGSDPNSDQSLPRWAPCRYVAQVLDNVMDASNTHTSVASAKAMAEQIKASFAHRRPQESDFMQGILGRPILLQAEV